eukprot:TRINITY_DN5941_c0_g1_i2.p1 TRINITY_DN5941_c0_g1~~TRINITY_DN5941_c0_g1_i2.p1  ORF type:complete len:344 (-),score=127.65 TRINITY_DN5941_c0_g1_i2:232-1263(-)
MRKSAAIVVAPRPKDDQDRVDKLKGLNILDTEKEEQFEEITRLVKSMLKVPISIIGLVDKERVFFKSIVGMEAKQAPRDDTFCSWIVYNKSVLNVKNAEAEENFAQLPCVRDLNVRSYLGVPLVTKDGFVLGSLCGIDTEEREFGDSEVAALNNFASILVSLMEMRALNLSLKEQRELGEFDIDIVVKDNDRLLMAVNMMKEGYVQWNVERKVVFVNDSFSKITGISTRESKELKGIDFFFSQQTLEEDRKRLEEGFDVSELIEMELVSPRREGEDFKNLIVFQTLFNNKGQKTGYSCIFKDVSELRRLEEQLEMERKRDELKKRSFFDEEENPPCKHRKLRN